MIRSVTDLRTGKKTNFKVVRVGRDNETGKIVSHTPVTLSHPRSYRVFLEWYLSHFMYFAKVLQRFSS